MTRLSIFLVLACMLVGWSFNLRNGVFECEPDRVCSEWNSTCGDGYEGNESPPDAAPVPCSGCDLRAIDVTLEGTLHRNNDTDFYQFEVDHAQDHALSITVTGLQSTREIYLGYFCPDGSEAIADCSGSSSSFGNSKYCIEDGTNSLDLIHECGSGSGTGTIVVGVTHKDGEFRGPCDTYQVRLISYEYVD